MCFLYTSLIHLITFTFTYKYIQYIYIFTHIFMIFNQNSADRSSFVFCLICFLLCQGPRNLSGHRRGAQCLCYQVGNGREGLGLTRGKFWGVDDKRSSYLKENLHPSLKISPAAENEPKEMVGFHDEMSYIGQTRPFF